jgi:hypothetical protein
MPTKSTPEKTQLLDSLDSYKDTVSLILALVHEMSWDDASKSMRTDVIHEHGSKQLRSPEPSVTPDLALRLGAEVGLIGEVKIGFAKQDVDRDAIRDQLLKYDDVVSRWKTRGSDHFVAEGCVVLLTHLTRKIDAAEYLEREQAAKRFVPKNPFGVVAGVRQSQRVEAVTLERSWGALAPKQKDDKLRRLVTISLELLQRHYAVKFYDDNPPPLYVLQVLWDHVLSAKISVEEFSSPSAKRGNIEVVVTAEEAAQQLRDRFSMQLLDRRLRGSPSTKTVARALDSLVSWGLAVSEPPKFRIGYRRLRGGTLEYFATKLAERVKKGRKGSSSQQMTLFEKDPKVPAKPRSGES